MVADKSNINSSKVLEHFIKTLDIKGLGPASVKKMGLTHPVDLFDDHELGSSLVLTASRFKLR